MIFLLAIAAGASIVHLTPTASAALLASSDTALHGVVTRLAVNADTAKMNLDSILRGIAAHNAGKTSKQRQNESYGPQAEEDSRQNSWNSESVNPRNTVNEQDMGKSLESNSMKGETHIQQMRSPLFETDPIEKEMHVRPASEFHQNMMKLILMRQGVIGLSPIGFMQQLDPDRRAFPCAMTLANKAPKLW